MLKQLKKVLKSVNSFPNLTTVYILELQEEPDDGSNAESGSSNPVTKSEPRQWKKGK